MGTARQIIPILLLTHTLCTPHSMILPVALPHLTRLYDA